MLCPGLEAYNAAVSACGGSWRHALALLGSMQAIAVWPDGITYNAAILACASGDLRFPARNEPERPRRGLFNDPLGSVGLRGAQEASVALELWHRLESAGVVVDLVAFDGLLASCVRLSRWTQLVQALASVELSAGRRMRNVRGRLMLGLGETPQTIDVNILC